MSTTEEPAVDPVVGHHLKYWSKKPPSEVGIRVAKMLDAWDGLHHFDGELMKKVEWSHPYFIAMKLRGDRLSTFDFGSLTRLVFLAHDHCIRVEIRPCNMQFLQLMFHPRHTREGGMAERHPTIEHALTNYRDATPIMAFEGAATP